MEREEAISILKSVTASRERMRRHVAQDQRLVDVLDRETEATRMAIRALEKSWTPPLKLHSLFDRKPYPLEQLRARKA